MSDNSSNNKRIARNSILLSIRMVIVLCITLYTTRALLGLLGVEDYGVYNVVCGFVSMFTFLNTSMSNGIQRFFNFELGKNGVEGANKIFCTSVMIQTILAIIIIVLCESFGLWYLHNKMVIPDGRMFAADWIFQFSMLSFLFIIIQAPFTAAVMAHERMDFYAVINVVDALLKLGIVFVIPLLEGDYLIVYGLLLALISVFDFAWYYLYCKKNFEEVRLKRIFHKQIFMDMLSFSGWNLFGSFSNMMREQGINLIMNLFFGPVVNAARGVATQINSGLAGFVHNILTPVRPQVIQSYAKNEYQRSFNLTFSISKFCMIFFYMMCLPFCLEIDFILHLWLGDTVPSHTSEFTIIILATTAILLLMGALATLVHASGKMRTYQVVGSIVKFLSVPISYFLLKYGADPEWALIMVFLFDLIGLVVGMFIIKTIMPFSVINYIKTVILPLIPIVFFSYIFVYPIHAYMNPGFVRLTIITTISIFIISLLTIYVGLNKNEKQIVKQIYNKLNVKI